VEEQNKAERIRNRRQFANAFSQRTLWEERYATIRSKGDQTVEWYRAAVLLWFRRLAEDYGIIEIQQIYARTAFVQVVPTGKVRPRKKEGSI